MKKFTALLFFLFFLCRPFSYAAEVPITPQEAENPPWLTGSLLAPTPVVVPPGGFNFEPFLFVTVSSGAYDNHWKEHSQPNFYTVMPFLFAEIGLFKDVDVTVISSFNYKETQGESSVTYNDLFIALSYQLLYESPTLPGIKLQLGELFPTGPYQKLNPRKLETDDGGAGSYSTKFNIIFSKLFHINDMHYLFVVFSPSYAYSAPVSVRGFNFYGGGFGTKGTVYPGNTIDATLSFEYSLTKRWALALDIDTLFALKTRFSGAKGEESPGVPAKVGGPPSAQITLAPALEYSWRANQGVIGGCWFTVAGRNSDQFIAGVIAYNYFY